MNLGVLVSGTGTNLQAILDAQEQGKLEPARVVLVVSNRPDAKALERARRAGVEAKVVDHKSFPSRDAFEDALAAALTRSGVELVALAGFMRLLSPRFLDRFPGRVVNIHPSLLPAFPGMSAPQQALSHGVKVTGVTLHFVDRGIDSGPIIAQRAIPVLEEDTLEALETRIHAEEHRLYPEVLRTLAQGRVTIDGRRVRVGEAP